jgi:hypothetical protein
MILKPGSQKTWIQSVALESTDQVATTMTARGSVPDGVSATNWLCMQPVSPSVPERYPPGFCLNISKNGELTPHTQEENTHFIARQLLELQRSSEDLSASELS